MEPRDPYESAAAYARRVAQSDNAEERSFIVRRTPDYPKEGLTYDPDRNTLTIYRTAFGAGKTNFADVFGGGLRRDEENYASAIGFAISATEIEKESYEANNGFGARVTVTRTRRQVKAIWERAGKPGEDSFVGTRSFRPVAVLRVEPDLARELMERGSTALLFIPRAPYQASGKSTVAPSFNSPREREDNIEVVTGDIQCAFLLDAQDIVRHAFSVK